jgi:hypothetical protein
MLKKKFNKKSKKKKPVLTDLDLIVNKRKSQKSFPLKMDKNSKKKK